MLSSQNHIFTVCYWAVVDYKQNDNVCLFQGCRVGVGVGVARSRGSEPGVGVGVDQAALTPTPGSLLKFVALLAGNKFISRNKFSGNKFRKCFVLFPQ